LAERESVSSCFGLGQDDHVPALKAKEGCVLLGAMLFLEREADAAFGSTAHVTKATLALKWFGNDSKGASQRGFVPG
jgi:hypothetical protein